MSSLLGRIEIEITASKAILTIAKKATPEDSFEELERLIDVLTDCKAALSQQEAVGFMTAQDAKTLAGKGYVQSP